jgi:hypothetical protein
VPVFPLRFRCRRSLLEHPIPAGELALPHGWVTERQPARPDHDGVTTLRTIETRPGWVPPLPRDGGVHTADRGATAATCRFPAASPNPRHHIPSPGFPVTRPQQRFSVIHPSGHFPACSPRMVRAPLDVNPDASNPTVTGDARQGREQAVGHWPGTTPSTSRRPPISEFTRIVRHRVATPLRTVRAAFTAYGPSRSARFLAWHVLSTHRTGVCPSVRSPSLTAGV